MTRIVILALFSHFIFNGVLANDHDYTQEIEDALSYKSQLERIGLKAHSNNLLPLEELDSTNRIKTTYDGEFDYHKKYYIPFDLDRGDLIKTSIAAGAAIILFKNDKEIKEFAEEHKTERTQVYADIGERYGAGVEAVALASGGYIVGVVVKNEKVRSVSLLALKSMTMSGLVTRAIKTTLRRKRPNATDDAHEWNQTLSDHSFPSGHTTLAFSIGTFIAESTKHKSKVIPILAYAASSLAGISRIHDSAHWASDVAIGALIGHLVTKNVMKQKDKKKGFHLTTYLNQDGQFMVGFNYAPAPKKKVSKCNLDPYPVRACLREAILENK